MSTRLELVQFVARKLGTEDPDDITSTTSPATDYIGDLVNAVDTAWEEIQIMHEGVWHWRREQQTLATVAATREYAFTDIATDCVGVIPFKPYPNADPFLLIGNDRVYYIPYQSWRGNMDAGTRTTGQPQFFTIRHDGGSMLEFDPTPDAVYTLQLDSLKDLQDLTADGTIPSMPTRFHRTIAWLACTYLAEFDESARLSLFRKRYTKWLNDLREDQLPKQRFTVRPIGSR